MVVYLLTAYMAEISLNLQGATVYPTAQNLYDDLRVSLARTTGEMFFFQGAFYTVLGAQDSLPEATRLTTNEITAVTGVKYGR